MPVFGGPIRTLITYHTREQPLESVMYAGARACSLRYKLKVLLA